MSKASLNMLVLFSNYAAVCFVHKTCNLQCPYYIIIATRVWPLLSRASVAFGHTVHWGLPYSSVLHGRGMLYIRDGLYL